MRAATVKAGLKLLVVAVCLLIIGSFYHAALTEAFSLSPTASGQFIYLAFFWSGTLGGCGIVVVIVGLLRSAVIGERVRLAPAVLLLLAVVALFFFLLYQSFTTPAEAPKLRPGETVII
jgi:hypothetical protein